MMQDTLYKLTGWTSLGFGAYCIVMASLTAAFDLVEIPILFALIFLAFGILYIMAGISMLRKGRMGFFLFFGFFGSTYMWSPGIPYYFWPMVVMPIVIMILMIAVFLRQFSRA
ncbi:MAG: hypothetical protein KKH41_02260 [Candidatus Thermoplasmatota archaeon]|nr:hypothetical protein [Euryarchaeota archaeon]MBU4031787.1 hypothetical protein [Candidatus Thermoplasmatota archaeon]MBU4071702.1 hypothetical protein [Candidatus Thermoplasmatota archaeon]MBU4143781.1 hypothetical protein [Candidatus Thermoplasmatota archaeon]MBU4591385.1 hypothetical protein [Candidatus Thermoplasmatota archaeon]